MRANAMVVRSKKVELWPDHSFTAAPYAQFVLGANLELVGLSFKSIDTEGLQFGAILVEWGRV